jgi:cytochrome oxidase Cu insertion factor (SCO1/SenC/PrrC family)
VRSDATTVARRLMAALALAVSIAGGAATHNHPTQTVLAPGYADLLFTPPAPGTYVLPSLGPAADGDILDSQGKPHRLYDLIGPEKITVLSFIYTSCSDVNGCPLASYVLSRVQDRVLSKPPLADRVRLLSVSFDPAHDTPAVLTNYARTFVRDDFDWQFLTTSGDAALQPILDAYDQWVQRDFDAEGNYLGSMSHILRVYLIDPQRRIRNIYSMSFLHADVVVNDIESVLAEDHH